MGFIIVFFPIKPFWVDEWRIIYNLKTKDAAALWGPLDLMQQFPRMYLQVIKAFTQFFDYSYISLRFPAFALGTLTLLFSYQIMQRLYPTSQIVKYLFILILASSPTFAEYYIQVKQYTMDLFMSVLALWQLLELLRLREPVKTSFVMYLLLCISFLAAPFFSYSYPILAGPIFIISAMQLFIDMPAGATLRKAVYIVKLIFPLLLCMASMGVFYIIDVAQLMKDDGMKIFWQSMMMQHGFDPLHFIYAFYLIFANVGSGLLFEIIYGITGMSAFILAIRQYLAAWRTANNDIAALVRLYAVLLIFIILFLFAIGKLPLGEPRLVCYSVLSIAILIINLIIHLSGKKRWPKVVAGLVVVLYLGSIGNIINKPLKNFSSASYHKKQLIYENVTRAIQLASEKGLPLFVTSSIAFPDQEVINFPLTTIRADILCFPKDFKNTIHFTPFSDMPADWVLKTYPAYKMRLCLPVYAVGDMNSVAACLTKIPGNYRRAVAVYDTGYRVVER